MKNRRVRSDALLLRVKMRVAGMKLKATERYTSGELIQTMTTTRADTRARTRGRAGTTREKNRAKSRTRLVCQQPRCITS